MEREGVSTALAAHHLGKYSLETLLPAILPHMLKAEASTPAKYCSRPTLTHVEAQCHPEHFEYIHRL